MFRPSGNRFSGAAGASAFAAPEAISDIIERSLDGAKKRDGRRRAPRKDRIYESIGGFCQRGLMVLDGMVAGEKQHLGQCRLGEKILTWDYWWPHFGIAADSRRLEPEETERKIEWATENGIMYFTPDVNTESEGEVDLGQMRLAADDRRAVVSGDE